MKLWRVRKSLKGVRSQAARSWHQHPLGLPVAVFLGLLLAGGVALAIAALTHSTTAFRPNSSYITIISYDQTTQTVPTKEETVGKLLRKLDIPVGIYDRVEPSMSTPIQQDNLRINIYRALPITIDDGGSIATAYSAAATPRGAVADAGIKLYPEDGVSSQPAEQFVAEQSVGERITIDRSVPLTLNDYGTLLNIRTHAETVAELLASKGIKLQSQDTVIPDVSTPITAGMQVFVTRKGTQIVTETQTIARPVQTVTDAGLSFGTTATRQEGSDGTQVLTYQVNTENGAEVGRTLLQTVTTVPAVPKIVARGLAVSIPADKQAVMRQAGIASGDFPYVDFIISHEGGWCPTKWQVIPGVTPGKFGVCPEYYQEGPETNTKVGYGICQSTPAIKMATAGEDWRTNVVTQLKWCDTYAKARNFPPYGRGWSAAYEYWQTNKHW